MTEFLARDEPVDLTNCEREPIHIPGAIQPHGVLLAIREPDWEIVHASANTAMHLGAGPETLLGHPLDSLLSAVQAATLRELLARDALPHLPPMRLAFTTSAGARDFDVAVHRRDGLVLLEMESTDLGGTQALSFRDLSDVVTRLREATSVETICAIAVQELRRLTGYDRTMIYRFDAEGVGEVIAEDRRGDLDPYLGLRYPASDIPPQARRLLLLARTRVIPDVAYTAVPIVPTDNPLTGQPLDLSYSVLRSVSPIHLEYLRNMGVGATLGVTIDKGDALWGMIIGHHTTPHPCPPMLRAACDLLGHLISLLIGSTGESEAYASRLALQQIHNQIAARMSATLSLTEPLVGGTPNALDLTRADGVALRLGGGSTVFFGRTPPAEDVERVVEHVRRVHGEQIFATNSLGEQFPEFAPLRETASGLLLLPFVHPYGDYVAWFRSELAETVSWGGDPNKAIAVDPATGRLGPRRSFAVWKELVRGRSRPWHAAEVAIATELRQAVASTLLRQADARLAYLGLHDALTDLPNRRFLLERLAAPGQHHAATRGVALLFIDIDHFKKVNDSRGHEIGDHLLVAVARRLSESTRGETVVTRLAGDEFIVLCSDITREGAIALAGSIVEGFRQPFLLGDGPLHATVSVGLAFATHGTGKEHLLRDADIAMYHAKRSGGDQFAVFEAGPSE